MPGRSPLTGAEIGPLAPAGHCSRCVVSVRLWKPVGQYSNTLLAGPLLAVPRALSRALSRSTSVAGSVEP